MVIERIKTHSDASRMMDVNDAFGIRSSGVNSRMEHKASNVDSKVRCSGIDQIALKIDQTYATKTKA